MKRITIIKLYATLFFASVSAIGILLFIFLVVRGRLEVFGNLPGGYVGGILCLTAIFLPLLDAIQRSIRSLRFGELLPVSHRTLKVAGAVLLFVIGSIMLIAEGIPGDYIYPARVAQAVELVDRLKAPIEEYVEVKGHFPPEDDRVLATFGVHTRKTKPPFSIASDGIEGLLVTMGYDGKTFEVVYNKDQKQWACGTGGPNPIYPGLLPDNCK